MSDLKAFELSGMHWGSSKKSENGEKRIWQSMPLNSVVPNDEHHNPNLYSELAFAY